MQVILNGLRDTLMGVTCRDDGGLTPLWYAARGGQPATMAAAVALVLHRQRLLPSSGAVSAAPELPQEYAGVFTLSSCRRN